MDDKQLCQNEVARKHGFTDWNDLFWNGDISQNILEDILDLYGEAKYETGFQMGVKIKELSR